MNKDYRILFGVSYGGRDLEAVIVYPETGWFALGRFDVSQRGGAYIEVLCGEEHLTIDEVRRLARQKGQTRYQDITEENWRDVIG